MDLVASEIGRFLASVEPGVLCIRGRWGVGKTFAWKQHLTDDDVFLDALRDAGTAEAAWISPLNINSAIRLLREGGRGGEADALVRDYVAAHDGEPPEFFHIGSHHFDRDDLVDDGLRVAFAERAEQHVDVRDPMVVLQSLGARRGWDRADLAMMARFTPDEFERMFEALSGVTMKPAIETVLRMGRSGEEASAGMAEAAMTALRRIAAKSPLRARRVAALGVRLDDPAASEE